MGSVWLARAALVVVAQLPAACGFHTSANGTPPPDAATIDGSPIDTATPLDTTTSPTDAAPIDAAFAFCDGTDSSLDLCVSFDNGVIDESMNHHSELAETGISLGLRPPGKYGVYLGTASDLLFDDPVVLQAPMLTIEGWIKPTMPSGDPVNQRVFDANGRFWMTLDDSLELECGVFVAANPITPGGDRFPFAIQTDSLDDGWYSDWHHVACMFDGTTLTAWIDGDCKQIGGPVGTLAPGSIGASVGSNHNQSSVNEQFTGGIDNFRVWTRPLQPQEICTAANRTNCAPACSALL